MIEILNLIFFMTEQKKNYIEGNLIKVLGLNLSCICLMKRDF